MAQPFLRPDNNIQSLQANLNDTLNDIEKHSMRANNTSKCCANSALKTGCCSLELNTKLGVEKGKAANIAQLELEVDNQKKEALYQATRNAKLNIAIEGYPSKTG